MSEVVSPKVSVCIPSYNSSAFIAQAIESVLCQEFKDFELIIIDNNSSDNTAEIVNRYAENDQRIHFEVNDENIGMVGNFNKCLERSRGEYVKFLCSDDFLSTPKSLGRYHDFLDNDESVSLVASGRRFVNAELNTIKTVSHYPDDLCCEGVDIINDCLFNSKNKIGEPSAVIFRKNQSARGFDEKLKQILDLEMWFYLLEQGKFKFIEDELVVFRVHQGQATKENKKSLVGIDDMTLLISLYSKKNYIKYGSLSELYLKLAHFRSIWRGAKKNEYTKECAISKIREGGNYLIFRMTLPFYPLLKRIFKGNY